MSFYVMEIHFGPFERRIVLPETCDTTNGSAAYENGFLRIAIPKARKTISGTVTIKIGR